MHELLVGRLRLLARQRIALSNVHVQHESIAWALDVSVQPPRVGLVRRVLRLVALDHAGRDIETRHQRDRKRGADSVSGDPGDRLGVRRWVPQRRIRSLDRPQPRQDVVVVEEFAVKIHFTRREAHEDDLEDFLEHGPGFVGIVVDVLPG